MGPTGRFLVERGNYRMLGAFFQGQLRGPKSIEGEKNEGGQVSLRKGGGN